MKATKIKELLRVKNIKLIDIAADLGVTHGSVSTVIHEKRSSIRISQAVADAIDMPIEDVFPKYRKEEIS